MNEVIQLDYANGRRPWSSAAIVALILGLCSGPIIFVVVLLTGVREGIAIIGSGAAFVVCFLIGTHCVVTFVELPVERQARGRALALIGFVATVLWAIVLIAAFWRVESLLTSWRTWP